MCSGRLLCSTVLCSPHSCVRAKSLQSCPTLCDPVNCSPTGSSVHGILQARMLEWIAKFSRGSSWLRDQTRVSAVLGISRWALCRLESANWGGPLRLHHTADHCHSVSLPAREGLSFTSSSKFFKVFSYMYSIGWGGDTSARLQKYHFYCIKMRKYRFFK